MLNVDERDFGRLEEKVDNLEKVMGCLRKDVKELMALAERSKGGWWMAVGLGGALGGVLTWVGGLPWWWKP